MNLEIIKTENEAIQKSEGYQVENIEFFRDVNLENLVKYPGSLKELLKKYLNDNQETILLQLKKDSELDLLQARETALKEAQELIETLTPQIAAAKLAISEPIEILTPK